MKCPRCGGESDEKKNYCPYCGAQLRLRDNSADETLRLPDLSGVPLGGQSSRRRESSPKSHRREDRSLKIILLIAVLVIAAALAVVLALTFVNRERVDIPVRDVEDNVMDNEPSGVDDDYYEPELPDDDHQDEPEKPSDEDLDEEGNGEDPDEEAPNDEPDEDIDGEPEQSEPPLVIAEPDERD